MLSIPSQYTFKEGGLTQKGSLPKTLLNLFITLGLLGMLSVLSIFYSINQTRPILIQSLESKTISGGPVFNQIALFSDSNRDVWMMNQSHHGSDAEPKKWDRLAIIVEKKTTELDVSSTVKFLQFQPGELRWSDTLLKQGVPYRVSCFICHSNGPRAIRPDKAKMPLTIRDQIKVFAWNLKIKLYPKLLEPAEQLSLDLKSQIPFRHRSKMDNQRLEVPSCTKCHNEEGWIQRGFLTRQNAIAVSFMFGNGHMPPPGFTVTEQDRKVIKRFIDGL